MFLFKKKQSDQKKNNELKNMKVYEIPYAKHFRGFKTFPINVHGDPESEQSNKLLFEKDLSETTSRFICFDTDDRKRMAFLYIDKYKIGAIFDADELYAIEHGLIEKIHYESEKETILGKKSTETRYRLRVLVKYKE